MRKKIKEMEFRRLDLKLKIARFKRKSNLPE
jgi:hypothetical protein